MPIAVKRNVKFIYLDPAENGTYAYGDFSFIFSLVKRRGSNFCEKGRKELANK